VVADQEAVLKKSESVVEPHRIASESLLSARQTDKGGPYVVSDLCTLYGARRSVIEYPSSMRSTIHVLRSAARKIFVTFYEDSSTAR
jgi:hypothetical protein